MFRLSRSRKSSGGGADVPVDWEARYFSLGPGGERDFFDAADNALIAQAEARGDASVRLPPKPYGSFEVRFGANAKSPKWEVPPESGMIQVRMLRAATAPPLASLAHRGRARRSTSRTRTRA